MRRSSESVAALATALAKAQGELVNPEKSLTATIRTEGRGQGEQVFRYAPLSSGLDIIRKTLGRHEIATVQTTAIDHAAGIVNLTTMLAHASGEWIASDWPVCPISDMAAPRRMGAALTYARRYSLFALVGIAGEDDLDAPDINAGPSSKPTSDPDHSTGPVDKSRLNGHAGEVSARPSAGAGGRDVAARMRSVLNADQSALLRDQLLGEIVKLTSPEEAIAWARRILGRKNTLTGEDARIIEVAFATHVAGIDERGEHDLEPTPPPNPGISELAETPPVPVARIDKNALAFGEPRRYRNKAHLKFVASKPCVICARKPSDPHHLRFAQRRALGRKVSDEFAVPLCRSHHRALHRSGDEARWWREAGIEPIKVARKLWKETRLPGAPRPTRPRNGRPSSQAIVAQGDNAPGLVQPVAEQGPGLKQSVSASVDK